jgi:NAD(P)-dependent dehydrogenase (short-subunit alcohol dehydrogenase family)
MASERIDKTFLMTGSSGIAAATIRLAGTRGANVFFVSNDEAQCAELAAELAADNVACDYSVGDLTLAEAAQNAVRECVAKFGRIDALFNVVGISGRRFGDGPIHECTEQGWDATMNGNLRSMFLMCRETIQQMLQQPLDKTGIRGAVLNMGSVLADFPQRDFFSTHAYAASKGAINALTKATASYYAPQKIRINAIAPGLVRTPMSERAQNNPAILELMKIKQPLVENLIMAEDIAHTALFLMSDEARTITGEVVKVDGGWSVS